MELLGRGFSRYCSKDEKKYGSPTAKVATWHPSSLCYSVIFFSYISYNKIRGNIKIKNELQLIQFRKR
jgi:hypothetical protein